MKPLREFRQIHVWFIVASICVVAVMFYNGVVQHLVGDATALLFQREGSLRVAPLSNEIVASLPLPVTTGRAAQERVQPALVSVSVTSSDEDGTVTEQMGTGIVWDQRGHVVLPARLLGDFERVAVTLPAGMATKGRLIGVDRPTNIAVVRLERLADHIAPISQRPVTVADGQAVRIVWNNSEGEVVVETGTVAATGRLLPIGTMTSPLGKNHITIPDVIKIEPTHKTSPIMPANALVVDERGTLLGMLLPFMDDSTAAYYAIPREMMDRIVTELIAHGQYQHPWLGVSVRTITPEHARLLDLPVDRGAQILAVLPGSPAERAGLRGSGTLVRIGDDITYTGGDIITGIEDRSVRTVDDLVRYLVRNSRVGDRLQLEVVRSGGTARVVVQVGARPKTPIFD